MNWSHHDTVSKVRQAQQHCAQQRYQDALPMWSALVNEHPHQAEFWFNLAECQIMLDLRAEARDALMHAQQLLQEHPDGLNAVGYQFMQLGLLEDAEQALTRALSLNKDHTLAQMNFALVCEQKGDLEQAEILLRQVLVQVPDFPEACSNLAGVLKQGHAFEEARLWCQTALKLNPQLAPAWSCLGAVDIHLERFQSAGEALKNALSLNPNDAKTWVNMGFLLTKQGDFAKAAEAFERALLLDPQDCLELGTVVSGRLNRSAWNDLPDWLNRFNQAHSQGRLASSPFHSLAFVDSSTLQLDVALRYASKAFARLPRRLPGWPSASKKIVLAYFSPDFGDHPVSQLLLKIWQTHDRQQFEIIGFGFGRRQQTAMGELVRQSFDRFYDISNYSDEEVMECVANLPVHLAIDLAGYTLNCRTELFARRLAPIQVSFLGYTGTMGMKAHDYLVADAVAIPREHFNGFSEQIVHLPGTYFPPNVSDLPASIEVSRTQQGLPENAFVFACFNNTYKFNPGVFDVWMRILWKHPNSVLWLSAMPTENQQRLRAEAQKRGVVGDRLIFAKRMEKRRDHLVRLSLADLFLDTWPYGAHTTASDALLVGLPVLTNQGEVFASRVASSLLCALGLPELVCTSTEAYEQLACDLAQDTARLRTIRGKLKLAVEQTDVFDPKAYTAKLERAYLGMVERAYKGLPPAPFAVA